MSTSLKGLRADIYKHSGQDFSNGGISSRCNEVTIVGPGIPEVHEANEHAPAVRINVRQIGGPVVSLEPVDKPSGVVGPMAGGCYVGTCDSRLREAIGFYGAVSLHDRFETQEQYNRLCD